MPFAELWVSTGIEPRHRRTSLSIDFTGQCANRHTLLTMWEWQDSNLLSPGTLVLQTSGTVLRYRTPMGGNNRVRTCDLLVPCFREAFTGGQSLWRRTQRSKDSELLSLLSYISVEVLC